MLGILCPGFQKLYLDSTLFQLSILAIQCENLVLYLGFELLQFLFCVRGHNLAFFDFLGPDDPWCRTLLEFSGVGQVGRSILHLVDVCVKLLHHRSNIGYPVASIILNR